MKTTEFSLRPESELLTWCARTVPTEELTARIRQRVQEPLHWDLVLGLTWYHGVGPLVHRNLSRFCADLVPPEPLTQLRRRAQAVALLNRSLAEEVTTLCQAFEAHGVPVIPIKGASLAASVYQDLTLRDFSDIDLLVPEGFIPEAKAVLLALGYEREDSSLDAGRNNHEEEPYHVFLKKQTPFRVDLQYVIAHQQFMFRLDHPEFWQHRTPVVLGEKTVHGLAPEDLLIVLCVHGSKHVWEALKWVCDVAELLQSQRNLDWGRIFRNAAAWRCQRLVYMGLSLAQLRLEASIPDVVLSRFSADPDIQFLSYRMPSTLLTDRNAGVNQDEAAAFYFSLKDSWSERCRLGLLLCHDGSRVVTSPPVWVRWRAFLLCLALAHSLLTPIMRMLLPPTILGAINRWVERSG